MPSRDNLQNGMMVAPMPNAVANGFEPAKYGEVSKTPILEQRILAAHDPRLDGWHILTAKARFALGDPVAGHDGTLSEVAENTLNWLEAHIPDLPALILFAERLLARAAAALCGISGGIR